MPTNKPEVVLPELPYELEVMVARLYADAYQAGHDATVDGEFIDLHPNDRDTYWLDRLREHEDVLEYVALTRPADGVTAGDAVFAFAGLLTSLPHVVPFGAAAWATPGADLAAAFNAANGLTVSRDFPQGLVFPKIEGELLDRVKQASESVWTTASGVSLIAAERARQVAVEGWTPEHDDEHADGELAKAAACYALPPSGDDPEPSDPPAFWPWHRAWWKPGDRIRELEKAGALIAAEIDRLRRLNGGAP